LDDPLSGYAVTLELPVQWGELDALQHVNNTVYLRWFETSRIAHARAVGVWARLESDQLGPILASVTCHYRRPVHFPETVRLGARVIKIGRTSMTFEHTVVAKSNGLVVADGTSVMVLYDYAKKAPEPIPPSIRQAIAELQGGEIPS
jgi:acyl-CoA thioester hydrolase